MDEKFECKCRKCNKKLRRKQFFDELQALQFSKKTKAENNHHFYLNKKNHHPYNIRSQCSKNTFDFSKNRPTFLRRSQRLQEKTKSYKSAPQTNCLEELIRDKPATVTSNLLSPFSRIETPKTSPPEVDLIHPEPITAPKIFNGFTNTSNDFNERFRRQVKVPVVQTALEKLRISIAEKVREINSVLNGEAQPEPMNKPTKKKTHPNKTNGENYPNIPLVSPSRWVYKTPPKQRINVPESYCNDTLKPFIYEANDKTSNIYEFDKGIYKYVNVSKLSDPNILIDSRFMQPINKNAASVCNLGIEDVTLQCVSPSKPYWKIKSPQEAPHNNPFGMCTERPRKKKRYLHSIFPGETYEKIETEEEFNASFAMLGEDSSSKNIFKSLRF